MREADDSPRRQRLRSALYLVQGIEGGRFARGVQVSIDRDEAPGKDFTLYAAIKTALEHERHPVGIAWGAYRRAIDGIIDVADAQPHFSPDQGKVRVRWTTYAQRLHDNTVEVTRLVMDESLPENARIVAALYAITQIHALLVDEMNKPYFQKELEAAPKPVKNAALKVRDFFDLKWANAHLPLDLTTVRRAIVHGRAVVTGSHVDLYAEDERLIVELRWEDLVEYLAVGRAAWIAFHLDVLLIAAQAELLGSRPPEASLGSA